jgi:WD40 repeat protein
MKRKKTNKPEEPEIYSIRKTGATAHFERRDFLKGLSVLTGSALLGCNEINVSVNNNKGPDFEIKLKPEKIKTESCGSLYAHSSGITCIAFNPAGTMLASAGYYSKIKFWSVPDGKILKILDQTQPVNSMCYSWDGKILATLDGDHLIKLWSFPEAKLINTLPGDNGAFLSMSFNPKSNELATGIDYGSGNYAVKIWSVPEGKEIKVMEKPQSMVIPVCYSPDGKILASGCIDNSAILWSVPDGKIIHTLKEQSSDREYSSSKVLKVSFSPDGKFLISGSNDNILRIWSIPDGKLIKKLDNSDKSDDLGFDINQIPDFSDSNEMLSLSYSPDGKMLASGFSDNKIKIWSMPDGQLMKILDGHSGKVNAVCFHPEGKSLASGSADKTIKLWSWTTYSDIESDASYEELLGDTFDPVYAGEKYIIGKKLQERKLSIIDLAQHKISKFVVGDFNDSSSIYLSESAEFVFSGTIDGKIKWYSLIDKKNKGKIMAHSGIVRNIRLIRNSSILLTRGDDGLVKFWSFPYGKLLKEVSGSRVAVNPEEDLFCVCVPNSDNNVDVYKLSDFSLVKRITIPDNIHAISFVPTTQNLLMGTDKQCVIYDFRKEKAILKVPSENPATDFSVSKNGKYLFSAYKGTDQNGFSIVDLTTKTVLKNIPFRNAGTYFGEPGVVCLNDDRIVYINDKIRIFSFTDYKEDIILFNCFYDKSELAEGAQGIRYTVGTHTMTLPCGSPIPAGYTCSCNCVTVGNPVTYYSGYSGGYSYYVSYWYPN